METIIPPSQIGADGKPVKRVVIARPPIERTKRPRTAKRLFLLFFVLFLIIVYMLLIEGN